LNKVIPLLAFSILLLVPAGAQNAVYAGAPPCNVFPLVESLGLLALDPSNCIIVDDKIFTNFRDLGNAGSVEIFGITVGDEKGLEFIAPGFFSLSNPDDFAVLRFAYDVISLGAPISDNTLSMDGFFTINDDSNSHLTFAEVDEVVYSDYDPPNVFDEVTRKIVKAHGDGFQQLSTHVDYPTTHQMVTVLTTVGVIISDTCVNDCLVQLDGFTQTFSQSPRAVGGEFLPIESTSLILAGAQTFSWMIPLVLSILGIGLFVVSRKNE